MLKRKKNLIGLDVIRGKSQCLRNKKEVRGIKFPEHPVVCFFVQGKERKKQVFLPEN